MRLLLIRHGQTPHNVKGFLDTAYPGAGLTPLGTVQARAVPGALAGESIAGVYASRLVRTQLTAAPLAGALDHEVRIRDGLEEVSAGELEMLGDHESVQAYTGCLVSWITGDLGRQMPGGSSGHEFLARYQAAVQALALDHGADDTIAVFSHGAAIRVFAALSARLDPDVATGLSIMNTGMAVLEGDPRAGWSLADWSTEPRGGANLEDPQAHDVTGESAEESAH